MAIAAILFLCAAFIFIFDYEAPKGRMPPKGANIPQNVPADSLFTLEGNTFGLKCSSPRTIKPLTAGWCRIFRNFSIFAASVKAKDERFKELERAMRIRGLSEEQIERYFSDMISKEELLPYLEGSERQGYRKGFKEGVEQGMEKGLAEGKSEGRASALNDVAKSMLEAGMSEDQITKVTGLDKEQITKLKGGR